MGLAKKLGIVVLLYVMIGLVWSVMMHLAFIPPPGGLSGPLNILYLIFQPITFVYFFIVLALGLYP
ncbi:MAG: hypothetical protein ACXAC0_07910 [Candidatus Thorarchaeota archaeon]|jgi:hypothetical protein